MKNHIIFSFLLASIIPHAHAMQLVNLSHKEEFELKRKAAQDSMFILNHYLNQNKPNEDIERVATETISQEFIAKDKSYWYNAQPILHATIALKLAKTKAKHAAKVSCEGDKEETMNLRFSAFEFQKQWINAELNLTTIQKLEKSFDQQARLAEKQRNLNNFQTRH